MIDVRQQLNRLLAGLGPRIPYNDAGAELVRVHVTGLLRTAGYHSTTDVAVELVHSPLVLAVRDHTVGPRADRRRRRARRRLLRAIARGWREPRALRVTFEATRVGAVRTMSIKGTVQV